MHAYIKMTVLLVSGFALGQVGIGTENPQATLDVLGVPNDSTTIDGVIAPRLTGAQLKSKDDLYSTTQDGTIVYVTEPPSVTSAKTKNVLQKGYYNFDASLGSDGEWRKLFFSPKVLAGTDGQNAYTGSALVLKSINGTTTHGLLMTRNFELKEKSLVTISASCPVSNITDYDGNLLVDGAPKAYGFNMTLTGNNFNNATISRDASSFTSSANRTGNVFYQIESTTYIILEPGTYKVDLIPFVHSGESVGVSVTFSSPSSNTVFDIVTFPIDE